MKITIPVTTRTQDNQDGGFTTFAYNNDDELIADHPKATDFRKVDGKWKDVPVKLTKKQRDDILNEDDPYENGYIGHDEIVIEIDGVPAHAMENIRVRLAKPLSFHAGQ